MSSITYEQFDKCYRVKRKLGCGTSAEVSLIESKTNRNQQYALKRIFLRSVDEVAANMNEVEIISLLKDKAVPKIYHYFTASNLTGDHPAFDSQKYHYEKKPILLGIIMERCETDVETHILRVREGLERHFDNSELWTFLKVMVDVLAKMQTLGILHRDIKPANILMNIQKDNKKKVFKLSDFGFSVYKNQFSIQSITGTRDYTSPRVRGKFDRPHINIDGINYKDDVFSLGKTLLEMMRLQNCANEEIISNLQKIQNSFAPNVVYILKRMLTISEKQRPDFLTIKLQMLQIQKKQHPDQFIDLTSSNSDEIEQQSSRNYCQSQEYQSVINRQVTLPVKGSQIQSEITADSSRRKPSQVKEFGVSYREKETQYIQNTLLLPEVQSTVKYLTTVTFNLANQIYCIQAVGDYLLLGMNTRLGVIPLQNNLTKRIYLLQLINLTPSCYKIKRIHAYPDYFLLILEQKNQFMYVKCEFFIKVIKDVMENHQKYRQSHLLRPAFPEINSPVYGGYKVYNLEFKAFDKLVLTKDVDITCIHMLKAALYGKASRSLFAFSDGSLSFYNQLPFYQNDCAIQRIQVVNENKIIITTKKDIKILSLIESKSPSEQKKWQVEHQYLLNSEIVYLKVIEQKKSQDNQGSKVVQSDSDEDNLVPLIEIVTADCRRIVLGNQLEEITSTKLQIGSKTIMYVLQSNFIYSIAKDEKCLDGESSAVKIKQHQNKNYDSLQFYYLTSAGKIKHSKSKKTLWQNPFKHFNKFHIGGNKIILTNFNGEIQILSFADEPPKKCMITQSQKEKHQQKTIQIPQYLSIRKSYKNVEQSIFTKPQMNLLLNKKQRQSYRNKIQYSEIAKLSIQRKD